VNASPPQKRHFNFPALNAGCGQITEFAQFSSALTDLKSNAFPAAPYTITPKYARAKFTLGNDLSTTVPVQGHRAPCQGLSTLLLLRIPFRKSR
jgi:hypothetical protein